MVLGVHLPGEYRAFADPLAAGRVGISEAVKKLEDAAASPDAPRGMFSALFSTLTGRASKASSVYDAEKLDVSRVTRECSHHARNLLIYAREVVFDFMQSNDGMLVAQAVATRLYKAAMQKPIRYPVYTMSFEGTI